MKRVTNMPPCENNNTSFLSKLQNCKGLDLRDNRGKRHDLAMILLGVTLAILSNRDGKLSSIHRHLQKHHDKVLEFLDGEPRRCVSRSHLPIVLEKVSVAEFDRLMFESYGIKLSHKQKKWFAVDGKELKGSIEKGATRGEVVVQAVAHETGNTESQNYYNGRKESEVRAVRTLLEKNDLLGQKISLDALHTKPQTLEPIVKAKGKYVVGLKRNQKELFNQVSQASQELPIKYTCSSAEKGHGRTTVRNYEVYAIEAVRKAERWARSKISTLVKVSRKTVEMRTGKETAETSYYISNEKGKMNELCLAVRRHWQVEVNNHVRDVTFAEDQLRTKKSKSVKY
jgi:predicted transposase YbfD/YdcC